MTWQGNDYLGFGKEIQDQVADNIKGGNKEFSVIDFKDFDGDLVSYELLFGPHEKHLDGQTYLHAIDVLLEKPIKIEHCSIGNTNTEVIENLLRPFTENDYSPDSVKELGEIPQEQLVQVQPLMKMLMDKEPFIFAQLLLKYNPRLDFAVPKHLLVLRDCINQNLVRYNKFHSSTTLTAFEMYNVLDGRGVLKMLERYGSRWMIADFSKGSRSADGSLSIRLMHNDFSMAEILSLYNFEEIKDKKLFDQAVSILEQGGRLMVTSYNTGKDEKVVIRADPSNRNIIVSDTAEKTIYKLKQFYKKNYTIKDGAVATFISPALRQENLQINMTPGLTEQQAEKIAQHREDIILKKATINNSNTDVVELHRHKGSREITEGNLSNGKGIN